MSCLDMSKPKPLMSGAISMTTVSSLLTALWSTSMVMYPPPSSISEPVYLTLSLYHVAGAAFSMTPVLVKGEPSARVPESVQVRFLSVEGIIK